MYEIAVHEDAHEPPSKTNTNTSLPSAIAIATSQVTRLRSEDSDYEFGTAGDDELFEIYPVRGHGTVIVSEVTKEERIEQLCDEGLEATAHAEMDDAEQKFRDILEVINQ